MIPETMTGPEPDEESPLIQVFAGFGLTLDKLHAVTERQNRLLEALLRRIPLSTVLEKQSTMVGGATTDTVDFGTPLAGRRWMVRLFGAIESPVGIAAPVAAVVTWHVGANLAAPGGILTASSARWQFREVPSFQRFTSDSVEVRAGQHLIARLAGFPADSVSALIVAIEDYPMGVRIDG